MKVLLVDLRNPLSSSAVEVMSFANDNDAPVVLVVGHGDSTGDSVDGFTADTFPSFPSARVIWFYACNCGKSLVTKIARRGVTAFGYVTGILAPALEELSLANCIRDALEDYTGDLSPMTVLCHVQDRLLKEAGRLLEQRRIEQNAIQLLRAALINHTRLSLRFAS